MLSLLIQFKLTLLHFKFDLKILVIPHYSSFLLRGSSVAKKSGCWLVISTDFFSAVQSSIT